MHMLAIARSAVLLALIRLFVPATLAQQTILVAPKDASKTAAVTWKSQGFQRAALLLDEATSAADYKTAATAVTDAGVELLYWIDVGRNRDMADKNPRWMAALGTHHEWLANFPNAREPGIGEVAKAYPWVPIRYVETFGAHLTRIEKLLSSVPTGWTGLLLNNLQGGPSSCGCGNIQCRWALDHHVPSTATKLEGDDVPARFVAEVARRAPGKQIIPVWTTECSEADLPARHNNGKPGTGRCGGIACAHSACEEIFAAQWNALATNNPAGPIALLATHSALDRTNPKFGGGPGWVTNAVQQLHQTLKARSIPAFSRERLWVVVEGLQKSEEETARKAAAESGVAGIIVSRIKIDQSYEPRIISTK